MWVKNTAAIHDHTFEMFNIHSQVHGASDALKHMADVSDKKYWSNVWYNGNWISRFVANVWEIIWIEIQELKPIVCEQANTMIRDKHKMKNSEQIRTEPGLSKKKWDLS